MPCLWSFIGQNPLVKQGLIPENLSEIFLPIFLPTSDKKRRIITTSRVLTGHEIITQLEQKEADEEEKKKKKEERREMAENKRKEAERKREEAERKRGTYNVNIHIN